ncbi:uncharacterized protein [Haliotis cracherodii]|uniref:uncharacterized protein n=1 Tax=Haliotis cracherodii TaxID=6455 RepID=UPI0039E9B0A8
MKRLVYFLVLVTSIGEGLSIDCKGLNVTVCRNHLHDATSYCGSDGKHYANLCEMWMPSCEHNVTVVGVGPHCDPVTRRPTHPPTTDPPLSPFERALFKNIIHGIDDRITRIYQRHISPQNAKLIYTKQDHKNKNYTRNTDCWAYGLDLTCMSPWNSEHGVRKAGTLVSPRHAVWARHYNIPVNTTIRFVDAGNDVVDRRIVATRYVDPASHSFWGHDIVVGLLDQDVPSTIGFARVLPRNLTSFRGPRQERLPTFSSDFEEKALIDDLSVISSNYASLLEPSKFSLRHLYYEPKIVGDSGNPTFFVINNELVLLFVFTSGGSGGGTSIVHYYDQINAIMATMGGGYRLTEVNLDGFLNQGHTLPIIIG